MTKLMLLWNCSTEIVMVKSWDFIFKNSNIFLVIFFLPFLICILGWSHATSTGYFCKCGCWDCPAALFSSSSPVWEQLNLWGIWWKARRKHLVIISRCFEWMQKTELISSFSLFVATETVIFGVYNCYLCQRNRD